MKKIIFLPILMTMALAGCGEDAPESTAKWSHEIKSEMNTYIGEVLPYVSFGEGFYHNWENSIYSIGDKGSSSVLKGYGDLLTAQGWDKYTIKEDDIVYKKHNSAGYLTLRADFSSVGNDISVTVKDHEDPEPAGEEWPDEVKTEMLTYVGEVLPYAPLNEATLHHELYYEYTEEEDGYNGYNWYITDDSETNVLEGYGEKLVGAGFIEGVDEDDYVCYQKTTSKGELIVYFDWYNEETDPETGEVTPAGNQIDCYYYLSGGGIEPTPTSGSVEIDMKKVTGIPSGSDFGSKTFAPGVTISTAVGGNTSKIAPKYYEASSGDCDLRCYAKNTLTISATGITKIEFTYSKKDNNQFTPSVGTISSDLQTWTGDANSVTFTLGATGQLRISKIVVYGEFAGGGEGGDPVDPPAGEYTPLSVAQDLDMWMWPTDYDLDNDFDGPDANGVVECKYADWYDENIENTEECLKGILESVLSLDGFPSYLTEDSDIQYDAENSQVYIFYATPDEEVAACIYAIYQDGEIGVSFETAPYEYYLVEE